MKNILGKKSAGGWFRKGYGLYEICPYQYNDAGLSERIGFFSGFLNSSDEIELIVSGNKTKVGLYMRLPKSLYSFVKNSFSTQFGTSVLKRVKQKSLRVGYGKSVTFSGGDFHGVDHFTQSGKYLYPFVDILGFFEGVDSKERFTVVFSVICSPKVSFFKKMLQWISSQFSLNDKDIDEKADDEEVKLLDTEFDIGVSFYYSKKSISDQFFGSFLQTFQKFHNHKDVKIKLKKCKNTVKFGSVVHFFQVPVGDFSVPYLNYVTYRKLQPPVNVPSISNSSYSDMTVLGTVGEEQNEIGILKEDKFRHVYIVGKTGMGKSTFISNMVRSDMVTDNGIGVIDPHGDLIDDVMAHIPSHRTNDVFVFDVSDTDHPVGFNILEYNSPDQKNLIASSVVSIFKKLFAHSWGPRLEYILRNVMLSILEYPNATLLHIMRMLTDKHFRKEVISYVKDPIILKFRRDEFGKWQDKQREEAVGPIANKIGQFLSSPTVRNIFSQPKSTLNIREIMDSGKILLVNLSKGKIGEDNASMIGSFLVSKFQIDAMSRADVPFEQRKDFYLYIDEFQNFATDAFESILSEARKYRLSLIVANQYTSQIQENVRNAIFGNVGTIVSFGLGYDDAKLMSLQFKELIDSKDLLSLPKFTAYVKLMIHGISSEPFTMRTCPLPRPSTSVEVIKKIKDQSRQRYAMDRKKLEELLLAWSNMSFTATEKVVEKVKKSAENEYGSTFSLSDILIGKEYSGLVKLKYNYGLFVTVGGVEGLLHKSEIAVPGSVSSRKGLYEIGAPIMVKAKLFKEIKGEKKVVWT